jgi:hypothetical protein
MEYMAEYESYGARQYPRREFGPVWGAASSTPLPGLSLEATLHEGRGLVAPLPDVS